MISVMVDVTKEEQEGFLEVFPPAPKNFDEIDVSPALRVLYKFRTALAESEQE